jgi:hypothetical protein
VNQVLLSCQDSLLCIREIPRDLAHPQSFRHLRDARNLYIPRRQLDEAQHHEPLQPPPGPHFHDDKAPQLPMEEKQINSVPFRPNPPSLLASHKRESAARFEQELLQAFNQRAFEFGLRVLVFEVEELEDERVSDLGIRIVALVLDGLDRLCSPSSLVRDCRDLAIQLPH